MSFLSRLLIPLVSLSSLWCFRSPPPTTAPTDPAPAAAKAAVSVVAAADALLPALAVLGKTDGMFRAEVSGVWRALDGVLIVLDRNPDVFVFSPLRAEGVPSAGLEDVDDWGSAACTDVTAAGPSIDDTMQEWSDEIADCRSKDVTRVRRSRTTCCT